MRLPNIIPHSPVVAVPIFIIVFIFLTVVYVFGWYPIYVIKMTLSYKLGIKKSAPIDPEDIK